MLLKSSSIEQIISISIQLSLLSILPSSHAFQNCNPRQTLSFPGTIATSSSSLRPQKISTKQNLISNWKGREVLEEYYQEQERANRSVLDILKENEWDELKEYVRERKAASGDSEHKLQLLVDRSYGNDSILQMNKVASLDEVNQSPPTFNKSFWVAPPFRMCVLGGAYLIFPFVSDIFRNFETVSNDDFQMVAGQFAPGVGVLYGTIIALTLEILYKRQQEVQEYATTEAALLGQTTQLVLELFVDIPSQAKYACQLVATQMQIMVQRTRAAELLLIMKADPYQYLFQQINDFHLETKEEDLSVQQEGLIDTLRAKIPELMEARAARLSSEASSLPPTHFLVLSLLTGLILAGYTVSTLTIVTNDGLPPQESRLTFAALTAVYVLFYNFAVDLNGPFDGVYQIRRSAVTTYLLKIRRMLREQPFEIYLGNMGVLDDEEMLLRKSLGMPSIQTNTEETSKQQLEEEESPSIWDSIKSFFQNLFQSDDDTKNNEITDKNVSGDSSTLTRTMSTTITTTTTTSTASDGISGNTNGAGVKVDAMPKVTIEEEKVVENAQANWFDSITGNPLEEVVPDAQSLPTTTFQEPTADDYAAYQVAEECVLDAEDFSQVMACEDQMAEMFSGSSTQSSTGTGRDTAPLSETTTTTTEKEILATTSAVTDHTIPQKTDETIAAYFRSVGGMMVKPKSRNANAKNEVSVTSLKTSPASPLSSRVALQHNGFSTQQHKEVMDESKGRVLRNDHQHHVTNYFRSMNGLSGPTTTSQPHQKADATPNVADDDSTSILTNGLTTSPPKVTLASFAIQSSPSEAKTMTTEINDCSTEISATDYFRIVGGFQR